MGLHERIGTILTTTGKPSMRKVERSVHWSKDRRGFLSVLESEVQSRLIDLRSSVLVVGASDDDVDVLRRVGFQNITVSNFGADLGGFGDATGCGDSEALLIDVEDIRLPSSSYDLILSHEVLHHCRSPHRALCEMLRISRKYVLFLEPNDSLCMRTLVGLGLSFPYELPAVIHHGGKSGGVRNSQIPNFIYRWNRHEVEKTVSSYIAERFFSIFTHPYWDFNVSEYELSLRRATKIGVFTSLVGPKTFIRFLQGIKLLLNLLPVTKKQGNKFFCIVEKHAQLRPWLSSKEDQIVFTGGQNGARSSL